MTDYPHKVGSPQWIADLERLNAANEGKFIFPCNFSIVPGDTARLNLAGNDFLLVRVLAVSVSIGGRTHARCMWLDGSRPCDEWYPMEMMERVDDA